MFTMRIQPRSAPALSLGAMLLAASLSVEADSTMEASLSLESNSNELEAVLSVESTEQIAKLTVFDPEHQPVFRIDTGVDGPGFSEISSEVDGLSVTRGNVLPAGTYVIQAKTITGTWLSTEALLSHDMLPAARLVAVKHSKPDSLTIEWTPVDGAQGYRIEIEQEALAFELEVEVAASATHLDLPADLLKPDSSYDIEIAVEADNGNTTVVEATFITPE